MQCWRPLVTPAGAPYLSKSSMCRLSSWCMGSWMPESWLLLAERCLRSGEWGCGGGVALSGGRYSSPPGWLCMPADGSVGRALREKSGDWAGEALSGGKPGGSLSSCWGFEVCTEGSGEEGESDMASRCGGVEVWPVGTIKSLHV